MGKQIQLGSGSFITRNAGEGYDEVWEIESQSLSITEVTLDLSRCTGIEVEGFEGQNEAIAECPPMESKTLFVIHRTPPFKFAISLSVREIPVPIEEQENQI